MQPKLSCFIEGVGRVIFNLHLGVGLSVLCQMEGVGHIFSNHHIFNCSGPLPPPLLFGQSLTSEQLQATPLFLLSWLH